VSKWMNNNNMNVSTFVPYKVETPYGIGWVTSLGHLRDDGIRTIELMDGKMTLYSVEEYITVKAVEGDDVMTMFGRGRVLREVIVRCRSSSQKGVEEKVHTKYHVQLSNWTLAEGNRIMLYILYNNNSNSVCVVKKKSLGEMSALERVDFAKRQKERAQVAFSCPPPKQYQVALNLYAGAVDSLQYVQYNASIDNYLRAELLVLMISCSNNAATCCIQLGSKDQAQQATRYATNSLRLIAALESKKGMKIHTLLQHRFHITDSKLFAEWRIKSYLIMVHAIHDHTTGYEPKSLDYCKQARAIVSQYIPQDPNNKVLKQQERELQKLSKKCMDQKRQHLQKEKARAQAMFGTKKPNNRSPENNNKDNNNNIKDNNDNNTKDIKDNNINKDDNIKDKPLKPSTKPSKPVAAVDRKEHKRVSFSSDTISNNESSSNGESNKNTTFVSEEAATMEAEEEYYHEPWYSEHKEALLLFTACGLATVSMMLFRKK